jgi:hypothetical protein
MTSAKIRHRIEIKNRRLGRCHSRFVRQELYAEIAQLNEQLAAALAAEQEEEDVA